MSICKTSDMFLMPGKTEWKLKNAIIQTIIRNGGIVFGGAARDSYLHDMNAIKFYDVNASTATSKAKATGGRSYDDPWYLPEFIDRLVVPHDIDVAIHAEHMDMLITKIRTTHNVNMTCTFKRDAKKYISNLDIEPGDVTHECWHITPIDYTIMVREIEKIFPSFCSTSDVHCHVSTMVRNVIRSFYDMYIFPIQLDIMILQNMHPHTIQPDPPFGNIDFECNGLILDGFGIRLSRNLYPQIENPIKRHLLLERVLSDIIEKKAVSCNEKPCRRRFNKMLDKGWQLSSKCILSIIPSRYPELHYEGTCIICLQNVPLHANHYKLKCCDARYHIHCLHNAYVMGSSSIMKTKECPMCRTIMDTDIVNNDIAFVKVLQSLESESSLVVSTPTSDHSETILI